MSNNRKELYEFGPFRIDPDKRILFRDGKPVPLQLKAFETLLVLVRHSEEVVLKDDLMKAVWPDSYVEEGNLTQNIFVLRKTFGDDGANRRYIATIPGRGYSFIEKVRKVPEEDMLVVRSHSRSHLVIEEGPLAADLTMLAGRTGGKTAWAWVTGGALALILTGGVGYFFFGRSPKLTNKDTIVLGDFANTTGDPVFDNALRQGLSAELEQSPFLRLLSDRRVGQTLALMAKPRDTRLDHDTGRQICQRSGSTAMLEGSIAQIGTQYLLTLKAMNCLNGDSLASAAVQASDKNHVLDALGKASDRIRRQLGESLSSVQNYDVPLESVTTSSLEALQAYSLGARALYIEHDGFKANSFYEHAVAIDPAFASAYARLGVNHFNANEPARAATSLQQAYELRERVSEREKLYIEAHHSDIVTGDLEAARKTYQLWAEIYPRDSIPLNSLGVICTWLGYYDQALQAYQAALKLDPGDRTIKSNIVGVLVNLGRIQEAKAAARDFLARYPDDMVMLGELYDISFIDHDQAGMQQAVSLTMGKPGWEDNLLSREANTAAYEGKLAKSLEIAHRAASSAEQADRTENAANYFAEQAVREALMGNAVTARELAKNALTVASGKNSDATAAMAWALAGNSAKATKMAEELDAKFSSNRSLQLEILPMIHGAAALGTDPVRAIEALKSSEPYEGGQYGLFYPAYFRGQAYLRIKQGPAAAVEFQKIIDHPGVVRNEPIGALALLGLARSYLLMNNTGRARSEYEAFLAHWKNADPDLPLLKQAEAEYARLRAPLGKTARMKASSDQN